MKVQVHELASKFIEGTLQKEDNEYLHMLVDGQAVRIPKSRVLLIFDDAPPQHPAPPPPNGGKIIKHGDSTEYAPFVVEAKARPDANRQILIDKLKNAATASPFPAPTVVSKEAPPPQLTDIEVIMKSDSKSDSIPMRVSDNLMTGEYTSALGKEIFSNPKVRVALGQNRLSGVPIIKDNKITYSVTEPEEADSAANPALGIQLATKAMSAMSGSGQKKFSTDDMTQRQVDFSMSHSPFKSPPKLSLKEED